VLCVVLSAISVFSGAGGLDLGFVMTGRVKVVAAVDAWRDTAETYARGFTAYTAGEGLRTTRLLMYEFCQNVLVDLVY